MEGLVGFIVFVLLIFGPVFYIIGLCVVAVYGGISVFSGKRRRGAVVLAVLMVWVFGPVVVNQGRNMMLRAEIDALRVIPADVSLRGSAVVVSIGFPDDPACTGLCAWAMEAGTVTVYGAYYEDLPNGRSWNVQWPDDLFLIRPNPASVEREDRYLFEPVTDAGAVRIGYVFSGLLSRQSAPLTAPEIAELSDGAPNLGSAVLDGWPTEGGDIVVHFASRIMRPSLHGRVLLGQDAYQYPSVPAQDLARRSLICGAALPDAATSCPE